MTTQAVRGFTIVEVVLFLAVTGLLTIGVLVGSSAAIAQQRYRDSVNSLKGFIQEQYSQTVNVMDGDVNNPACSVSDNSLVLDSGTLQPRGTSDCLLLGRYLVVQPTQVTAYDVIGRPLTDDEGGDDIDALQNYVLGTSGTAEVEEIAWGARLVRPNTTNDLTASVMIVRSPLSGSVLTFVSDGNQQPSALVTSSNMVQKDFCVDPQAGVVTSQRLAVRINRGATSQSSVEVPLEGDGACG